MKIFSKILLNQFTNKIYFFFLFNLVYASSADLEVTDDGESSLYNNDENHKIWMGSNEQLNGINGHQQNGESHYDFYSNGINGSSTLGRPNRQRQIAAPVPVPPPPKEEIFKQKKTKDNKKSKSIGSQSLSGTLIRPRPIHPMGRAPPPHMIYAGHMMPPPHHPLPPPSAALNGRQFHTIGHHRGHPHPPPMMHPPMHMPPTMQPIILPPQYATLQSLKNKNKKKGKEKMNGIPVPLPMPPMFYPHHHPAPNDSPRALGMSNRKLAQSTAALDDSGNSETSPCGTGIYRRKGHLNERAFSYSIRQEHRSRSHGSLASLQFNPPDMKKEREIIQLVSDLELNDESTLKRNREMSSAGSSGTFGKPRR